MSSYEFLQRTEDAFRTLHQRVLYLEERQIQGPSDEQLERVLRRILAERFAGDGSHRTDSMDVAKGSNFFLEGAKNQPTITPINIDPAALFVEPESVPSRVYAETFRMLQGRLAEFPNTHQQEPVESDAADARIKIERERSPL